MANEIYNLAHRGLSDMISARAATNILNKALKSKGYKKARLDYSQAKEIMQGYVFEELRNILPSQGVKRQIRNIIKKIAKEDFDSSQKEEVKSVVPKIKDEPIKSEQDIAPKNNEKDAALESKDKEPVTVVQGQTEITTYVNDIKAVFGKSEASFTGFEGAADTNFDNALVVEDSPDKIDDNMIVEEASKSFAQDGKYDDISDDLFEAVSKQTSIVDEEELAELPKEELAKTIVNEKKILYRKQTKESIDFSVVKLDDLEDLLQNFALVEEARAVAIVSTSGKLLSSRGKGFDLDKMASLSNMALMLLKKSGKIRSYHLLVDSSQLFLFPVAEYLIVVIGSQEINFGEVISVFSTFEEEI